MYAVTPFRNGLTLGATNSVASAAQLYGQVFSKGFFRGWTGGVSPAIAACPQFLCLGPAYHFYAGFAGVPGAVVLASLTETAIVYGAETRNAQMATNQRNPGKIGKLQPSFKPWGPGVSLHAFRNIIAFAGLRMFCEPCTSAIEKATGRSNGWTQLGGDFSGNVMGACLSAPVHQLYGYTVTSPDLWNLSWGEQRNRMFKFLKDQYLVTRNGRTRLSAIVPRDLFMRSMYVAVEYTMYSTLERNLIAYWPHFSWSLNSPLTLRVNEI